MSEIDKSPCREEVLRVEIERLTADIWDLNADLDETNMRAERQQAEIERLRERDAMWDKANRDNLGTIDRLRAEVERLRAYAQHERSLGAEGPMIELTDARQEIERLRSLADDMGQTNIANQVEIERLHNDLEAYQGELDKKEAEIERLRAREAQAKTIIRAAAVYVSHVGGWQATWHRDADKWLGNEHAGSKTC